MSIPDNINILALFSYEQFLAKGRGAVWLKTNADGKYLDGYEYIAKGKFANLCAREIDSYNPEDETVFVISRPDGSIDCEILAFQNKSLTPMRYYVEKTLPTG